jgi:hypothetical protein
MPLQNFKIKKISLQTLFLAQCHSRSLLFRILPHLYKSLSNTIFARDLYSKCGNILNKRDLEWHWAKSKVWNSNFLILKFWNDIHPNPRTLIL